ncbi:MAG: glycosyltransferase family 39 protein [Candidatus Omnitrophota bacterium]
MLRKEKIFSSLRPLLIPAAICAIALAIRIIYLNQIKNNPFFIPYKGGLDDYLYDTWAKEIAFKDLIGKDIFWGLPLYPYFLGAVFFLFGHDLYIARLVQFAIGAASCSLLFFIGKKIGGTRLGALAALMLALYRPAIFYEGFLSSSFLSIFLNLLTLLVIVRVNRRPTFMWWLGAGALIGLSGLSSASIFLFMPFLICWMWTTRKGSGRCAYPLAVIVGTLLMVGSVTVRNYAVGKDFVPISWHNGLTFYAGNNPAANGTFSMPPSIGTGVEQAIVNSRTQAEQALGKRLRPSEISSFWFNEGLAFITHEPGAYVKLTINKFLLFWNAYEISDVLDIHLFIKKFAPILQLPLFTFGIIFPFACLGMLLSFKKRSEPLIALLYLLIVSHMISVLLYFVNGRYRLPIVPYLMIFAAIGLIWTCTRLWKKEFMKLLAFVPLLAGTLFFENIHFMVTGQESFYNNLGVAYKRKNMLVEAEREYKEALRIRPDYITPHFNLGILYQEKGDLQKAEEEFKITLSLNPAQFKAYNKLADIDLVRGDRHSAFSRLTKSLAINPRQPDVQELLEHIR